MYPLGEARRLGLGFVLGVVVVLELLQRELVLALVLLALMLVLLALMLVLLVPLLLVLLVVVVSDLLVRLCFVAVRLRQLPERCLGLVARV